MFWSKQADFTQPVFSTVFTHTEPSTEFLTYFDNAVPSTGFTHTVPSTDLTHAALSTDYTHTIPAQRTLFSIYFTYAVLSTEFTS